MRLPAVARAAVIGLALAACTRADAAEPDARGVVKHVERPDPSRQALAVVHLDPLPGRSDSNVNAAVTLTGASEVYVASAGREQRTDFRALSPGQTVEVWYAGPAGETNPTQGQARKITIHANR